MARNMCRNCGKAVKSIDGVWHHVWMVNEDEAGGRRIYAGNLHCSWRGRPGQDTLAQPFPVERNPLLIDTDDAS
jgi:hypothetical protein